MRDKRIFDYVKIILVAVVGVVLIEIDPDNYILEYISRFGGILILAVYFNFSKSRSK